MTTSDCYCPYAKGQPHKVTHGVSAYRNHHCRCDECRTEWAADVDRRKYERYVDLILGRSSPRHGTVSTYTNHMCRCDACRAANTAREAVQRRRRKKTA